MSNRDYLLDRVEDQRLRDVFNSIIESIESNAFVNYNGKIFDKVFTHGNHTIRHYFGFVPADSFVTFVLPSVGTAAVTFRYQDFTDTHFGISVVLSDVTASVRVRFVMGRGAGV